MRSAILLRIAARSAGAVLPQASLRLVRGVERQLDIGGLRAGDLADRLAGDRAEIVEILAVDRGHPIAADEIVVAGPQGYPRIQGLDDLVKHEIPPKNHCCLFFRQF